MRVRVEYLDGACEVIDLGGLSDADRLHDGKIANSAIRVRWDRLAGFADRREPGLWIEVDHSSADLGRGVAAFEPGYRQCLLGEAALAHVFALYEDGELKYRRFDGELVRTGGLARAAADMEFAFMVADAAERALEDPDVREAAELATAEGAGAAMPVAEALGIPEQVYARCMDKVARRSALLEEDEGADGGADETGAGWMADESGGQEDEPDFLDMLAGDEEL